MAKGHQNSKTSGRRYKLEISERQAQLISQSTELFARLDMGQFDMLDYFFWGRNNDLDQARFHMKALQKIRNGSSSAYPGIKSETISDDFRVLFDLYQVIRHRLAWDRHPHGNDFGVVDFNDPNKTSTMENLATIQNLQKAQ